MKPLPSDTAAHEAFQAYADAKQKAEATMDFADALAAGRAWRVFINLFVGPFEALAVASRNTTPIASEIFYEHPGPLYEPILLPSARRMKLARAQ